MAFQTEKNRKPYFKCYLKNKNNITNKKWKICLTCLNHSCLAQGERHGYQGEGGEVHAPWSPFLPEGTSSNIHSVAVVLRPGSAVNVGYGGSYPLTESQPTRGARLTLLWGNRQKSTPLETSLPFSGNLPKWVTYINAPNLKTKMGLGWINIFDIEV